ncbi:MAG: ChpI protein [Sporichthyaceae bacterium]
MKIAISLPDDLFTRAELAAERLGFNRSQLYARALEDFLIAQGADPVTARLDALAEELPQVDGSAAGRALIESGGWEW